MFKKIAILVAFMLILPGTVQASCSIGSTPLSANLEAIPGETVTAVWNFYNIHGDRITHVALEPVNIPLGWEVSFEPGLRLVPYNVSGIIENINENVGLLPIDVVLQRPDIPSEGMDYIKHPNEEGYIPIRPVKIHIRVPENTEMGKTYYFNITAIGNCFQGEGTAIPGVSTEYQVAVKTKASHEFFELPIQETNQEQVLESQGIGITGFLLQSAGFLGLIILFIIVMAIIILRKK